MEGKIVIDMLFKTCAFVIPISVFVMYENFFLGKGDISRQLKGRVFTIAKFSTRPSISFVT